MGVPPDKVWSVKPKVGSQLRAPELGRSTHIHPGVRSSRVSVHQKDRSPLKTHCTLLRDQCTQFPLQPECSHSAWALAKGWQNSLDSYEDSLRFVPLGTANRTLELSHSPILHMPSFWGGSLPSVWHQPGG